MDATDRDRILARFWPKVEKTDSCWIWRGASSQHFRTGLQYGSFRLDGKMRPAHRVAYALLVGPVSDDLDIDHVRARGCVSTLCVNPAHLEPVTHRENVLRAGGTAAIHARKTECDNGHPFSGDNLLIGRDGRRVCRACNRARYAAFRARVATRP